MLVWILSEYSDESNSSISKHSFTIVYLFLDSSLLFYSESSLRTKSDVLENVCLKYCYLLLISRHFSDIKLNYYKIFCFVRILFSSFFYFLSSYYFSFIAFKSLDIDLYLSKFEKRKFFWLTFVYIEFDLFFLFWKIYAWVFEKSLLRIFLFLLKSI